MIDLAPVRRTQAAWASRPLAERCRVVRSIKTRFARRANDTAAVVVGNAVWSAMRRRVASQVAFFAEARASGERAQRGERLP